MTYDCEQRGHHWHEGDGTVFARRKARGGAPRHTVPVECCHCHTVTALAGYGEKLSGDARSVVSCAGISL